MAQRMVRSTASRAESPRARGRQGPASPIDMVHLAKQTLGDKGLELEVLRMFDETAHIYFGRLERSTRSRT
jgi:hypothetical protein